MLLGLHLFLPLLESNLTLKDQLNRAASSIPLNLAEGCGRIQTEDRKRFYSIARGSATECAAICDRIVRIKPELTHEAAQSKKILLSIVCILSKIILKYPRAGAGQGDRPRICSLTLLFGVSTTNSGNNEQNQRVNARPGREGR